MDKTNHPLVSVFVVTYNAGEYICETLDSIKAQTYDNIELIVSDDYSSDETVSIANEWIAKNKERFVRTEVITVDYNTGVSANYNRAVKACRGEWVKNVDGDDLLRDNCIEKNIDFIIRHPEASIVFSNAYIFKGSYSTNIIGECIPEARKFFFTLSAEEQLKTLLKVNLLPSQTCFVKLDLLRAHPYNENYFAIEDAPMWVYLTRDGEKIFYFDDITAYYRIGESATSGKKRFYSLAYVESVMLFFWMEQYPLIKRYKLHDAYSYNRKFLFVLDFATGFLKNRKNFFTDLFFRTVRWYVFKFSSYKL